MKCLMAATVEISTSQLPHNHAPAFVSIFLRTMPKMMSTKASSRRMYVQPTSRSYEPDVDMAIWFAAMSQNANANIMNNKSRVRVQNFKKNRPNMI